MTPLYFSLYPGHVASSWVRDLSGWFRDKPADQRSSAALTLPYTFRMQSQECSIIVCYCLRSLAFNRLQLNESWCHKNARKNPIANLITSLTLCANCWSCKRIYLSPFASRVFLKVHQVDLDMRPPSRALHSSSSLRRLLPLSFQEATNIAVANDLWKIQVSNIAHHHPIVIF